MPETLKTIFSFLGTAVAVWSAGAIWWTLIGGRRGLRNRWVWGLIVVGVLGLVAAFLEAFRQDRVHEGLASPRPGGLTAIIIIGGMSLAVIGLGWSVLAAIRRDRRIGMLLRFPEMEIDPETAGDDDFIREQAEALALRPNMEALLKLIEPTGGAPEYDWLTPEWVREQLQVLPAHPDDHQARLAGRSA